MAGKKNKIVTTIEIDKELFLKFKALCVLEEKTISSVIEELLKDRVTEMGKLHFG